ncbi:AMP-binding protein [Paraconexibacter antarcticus]|uniref:Acyl-CoA synthetase n=1 Tax=Paraconexibacter antarcticus TaxID=2949664 RepID=A0ABY5DMG5_9ACTN|nr:AMP-binding protein [Paraconexibacter antarcticus]UTI62338.1 AMP-binding protein [Paraconexibacter antarcticus]
MSDTVTAIGPHEQLAEALAQPTLAAAFVRTATAASERVALREWGSGETLTYAQWLAHARAVAGGLQQLGVARGDRVALLLGNTFTFHVVDAGALVLGAAPFSLYNTAPVPQLLEYIDNAEPTVLVAEAAFAERAREVVALRPGIRLVLVDTEGREGETTLAQLEASCPPGFDVAAAADAVRADDLLTLVYTSGTTGRPKGVQYVHGGAMFALQTINARLPVSPLGRNVSYLPMAHIAERLLGHYAGFVFGYEITPLPDMGQLVPALKAIRPTRFFGVPRMFEKVEVAMHELIAQAEPERAAALRAAWEAGIVRVRAEQAGEPVPATSPEHAAGQEELRAGTGLDHAEWLGAAGAPVARELAERFHAVGLKVNELWGMSESMIGSTCHPDRIRLGCAGLPFDGFEFRVAEDGELLMKSPTVTPGYFREPERTAEAIDPDGWLHTGDLARIDDDGYVSIIGRKKELIINSAGKNMSPITIEQAIRGSDPLLAFCVCFGDARPYNVALLVLDAAAARSFAHAEKLGDLSLAELSRHPRVLEHLQGLVDAGNARLSRVEQIKRWAVLDEEWAPGGEELTLTNKLRRAKVVARYAAQVAALYAAPRAEAGHVR